MVVAATLIPLVLSYNEWLRAENGLLNKLGCSGLLIFPLAALGHVLISTWLAATRSGIWCGQRVIVILLLTVLFDLFALLQVGFVAALGA